MQIPNNGLPLQQGLICSHRNFLEEEKRGNYLQRKQNCLAKALYDNISETPDELSFHKGDILTVLEQNTAGLEGWWLCSLRGRQGIAPGNRLRLLPGMYDSSTSLTSTHTSRRSWHSNPYKVLTPQKIGTVYLYDVPPSAEKLIGTSNDSSQGSYDTPPPPKVVGTCNYDVPQPQNNCLSTNYDKPIDLNSTVPIQTEYDVPQSNRSSGVSSGSPPPSPTSTASHSSLDLYDIPPSSKISLKASPFYDTPRGTPITYKPICNLESVYDIPPQVTRDAPTATPVKSSPLPNPHTPSIPSKPPTSPLPEEKLEGKELLLGLEAAMENLAKLQQVVQSNCVHLFGFVGPSWRNPENMEPHLFDIKQTCNLLGVSLSEFLAFSLGALANASHASDKNLGLKLRKLIIPVREAQVKIRALIAGLDTRGWPVIHKEPQLSTSYGPDELDQIVAIARTVIEDVRQVASFIQGNSPLLFKRSSTVGPKPLVPPKPKDISSKIGVQDRPLPPPPTTKEVIISSEKCFSSSDEYDYVNLESRESVEKGVKLNVTNEETKEIREEDSTKLSPSDQKILQFYCSQYNQHLLNLTSVIDSFLLSVETNQPPKVFVGHSKLVVLAAYKLVFVGDTVHRNIENPIYRTRAHQGANGLCDALRSLVSATKTAALQFPSVSAVQAMVDSVVDLSHSADQLNTALLPE
ncbi:NEDD9 [Cordylochernes scorpioides]|uniref:NEDD9 n=1 Tax=Cordylochernes scorpioides TaxID=51811 RepID=A0ABY6LT54_9ARAC|nr:NEDD9 [Cordylochernes scorpioides]